MLLVLNSLSNIKSPLKLGRYVKSNVQLHIFFLSSISINIMNRDAGFLTPGAETKYTNTSLKEQINLTKNLSKHQIN